jgi:hypothetical protein
MPLSYGSIGGYGTPPPKPILPLTEPGLVARSLREPLSQLQRGP